MHLDGYKRLEVHVPDEMWDRIEKAREEQNMTRSEWVRTALVSHLASPAKPATAESINAAMQVRTARELLAERTRKMREHGE